MIQLSKHAAVRANQRGVTRRMIEDLVACADIELPAGGGCTVLRASRKRLLDATLRREIETTPEKLASLALLWSDESGEVVTVLIDHGGRQARRYRRLH